MIPVVMTKGFTHRYSVVYDICLGVLFNSAVECSRGYVRSDVAGTCTWALCWPYAWQRAVLRNDRCRFRQRAR